MNDVQLTRPEAERLPCHRCGVDFRPDRTDGQCPICREPAPGNEIADADPAETMDYRAMIVIGMSALNLIFLGVLAAVLFG